MADLYVCPACDRSYNGSDRFVDHAIAAHGHRPDVKNCDCACCTAAQLTQPKEE